MNSNNQISKTIGIALLATTVVVATGAALVMAVDFVLLIFLAVLFGVFLTKTSHLVDDKLSIGYGASLGLITTTLLALLIGTVVLFGVNVEQQLDKTSAQLDKSSEKLNGWLDEHPLLASTFRKIPFAREVVPTISAGTSDPDSLASHLENRLASPSPAGKSKDDTRSNGDANSNADSSVKEHSNSKDNKLTERKQRESVNGQQDQNNEVAADSSGEGESKIVQSAAGKVFAGLGRLLSTTLGAVANIGIVFFMGVFIAVNPTLYRDGVVWLFPKDGRERTTEVMNKVGETMFKWLNGRFLAMLITGVGTAIALMILGVPMALTVGVITGLLTFIPNIGGLIALVIAMLLALTVSPLTVLWVAILYGVLQLIESNIITPLVQQHQTSIPPALLIGFQILMEALTGFLGLMVSTPLLAAGMVVVKELWIKDTLNDDSFDEGGQTEEDNQTDEDEQTDSEQGESITQENRLSGQELAV